MVMLFGQLALRKHVQGDQLVGTAQHASLRRERDGMRSLKCGFNTLLGQSDSWQGYA